VDLKQIEGEEVAVDVYEEEGDNGENTVRVYRGSGI